MRPPSRQLRIIAIALGFVALWWLLWKAIDSGAPPGAHGIPNSRTESAPGANESTDPPATVDFDSDERESLGSPTPPAPPAAEVVETPAGPRLRLLGSLVDERSREPVSNASLRLVDSGWEERTAQSGRSGEYAFEDLQPGTWELAIESLGHRTFRRTVELAAEEADQRLDLLLTPGEIVKVKLVGTTGLDLTNIPWRARSGLGEEFWRLEPVVTLTEPSGRLSSEGDAERSDVGRFVERTPPRRVQGRPELDEISPQHRVRLPDGSAIIDLQPPYCGAFVLSKPLPVYASLVFSEFALQTRAVLPGADEVTFELAKDGVEKLAAEVRLRVVDGDTASPPGSVHVTLGQRLGGRKGTRREADGTFVFEAVLPGTVRLAIIADEREPVMENVEIQPGAVTDLGLYRLRPFSLIRARVLDDAGEPAQVGFNVFPLDRYAQTRETLGKRIFRSSVDGELKIDSVGRGRYLILANDEAWVSMPASPDTTLTDVEGLEIRVSKGTPVALRLRADPLPAARLEIRTRSGLPVAERRCRNRDPMKFLLVPGTYSIELWDGENWLASETLTVGTEPVRLYFPR